MTYDPPQLFTTDANHSELVVLDHTGDTRLIWDPANADEVANARRTFDDLTAKGHLAFSADEKGDKGEQIRKFDPGVRRMILIPRMVGG